MERTEVMRLMDELETLVMKKGWPVPFTPYYLVQHEKMMSLMDELRASLQDEMDNRFIKAFAPNANEAEIVEKKPSKKSKGKERSH